VFGWTNSSRAAASTFWPERMYDVAIFPQSAVAADFNGDGKTDLATGGAARTGGGGGYGQTQLSVLLAL
jgi:hypothetical protein